jgi:hypothetical protein
MIAPSLLDNDAHLRSNWKPLLVSFLVRLVQYGVKFVETWLPFGKFGILVGGRLDARCRGEGRRRGDASLSRPCRLRLIGERQGLTVLVDGAGTSGEKMPGDELPNAVATPSNRRFGAKTRSGKPCAAAAVRGRKRCWVHGGAPGSGAPRNKKAPKHGLYSRDAIEERRQRQALMRQARRLVQEIE